jgi:hypothetical protein
MRTIHRLLVLTAAIFGMIACTYDVRPTDTGYEGTWSRETERSTSAVAIVRHGDRYLFRWTANSVDGDWKVVCDWDGVCEEFVNHEKTSDYRFRTWTNEETGNLMVECTGHVFKPKERDIHYVDELVLEPDGLTLWSYTIERAGQTFEGDSRPKTSMEKVSDGVAFPPDLSSGEDG